MKQILSFLLTLVMALSLAACGGDDPVQTTPGVPDVTAPSGGVYSDQPFIDYPQTGEYLETALMANIPGQGCPLLLSVRSDGTVDYIFADVQERGDFQSFGENEARYYTISPDGTAAEQPAAWMEDLDAYTAETDAAHADPNGRWRFRLAASDDVLLILAQYHNVQTPVTRTGNVDTSGEILHSAVLKVEDGILSMVPMEWKVELPHQVVDLSTAYIDDITLENGQIVLHKRNDIYVFYYQITTRYAMDGALLEQEYTEMDPRNKRADEDGLIVYCEASPDPRFVPYLIESILQTNEYVFNDTLPEGKVYTEDDSLYRLGMDLPNIELEAYGADGTFYIWFRERENGLLMRYQPNPEGAIQPEEVTVWSLNRIGLIDTAVAKWNSTHASPIFRYEVAMEAPGAVLEDVLTRLNLKLSSGQGPDVLILDGLHVDSYLDFMVPLDRLDTAGVYDSILERFTENGDLLAVPARMNPYLMGRSAGGTREIGSLEEFADLSAAATDELEMSAGYSDGYRYYEALYNVYFAIEVFQLWYPAWADAIFEGGRLNEQVYRDFLTQTKRLTDHYNLGSSAWFVTEEPFHSVIDATDDAMWGNNQRYVFPYTLAATDHVGLYTYWWYEDQYGTPADPISCVMDPIPGPDGTGAMVPKVIASVRSGGSESAGVEFLQLLLSDELQLGAQYYEPGFADGYPVKWSAAQTLLERTEDYMNQEFAVENDFEETLSSLRAVVLDDQTYRAMAETAMYYYREEITLDEAVEQVRENTSIYLAEQSR